MSQFQRLLTTLEMLGQELNDETHVARQSSSSSIISPAYLSLITQYRQFSLRLADSANELSQREFYAAVMNQQGCTHLVNKKMLLIQNRLLDYAIKYYEASQRIGQLRDSDFSEQAEIRFDLLTTRAVKYKSQYRTVAQALSKRDYEKFVAAINLPKTDWGWNVLIGK